jgi:hypothetical protein
MTLLSPRRAALVAGLIAVFGLGVWFGSPARKRDPDPPVILKEIQALSELVTIKYIMSKVVTHEIEKTFGKDKVLLVAHGVVKAGIDLGKMTADDIRASGNAISIRLPKSTITDHYLDEKQTFVYDRRTGFFVAPDKNLESEARRIALAAILSGAHSSGIHKEADDRARKLLVPVFQRLGFESIVFQ